MSDIIQKILVSLITAGISWMIYTEINHEKQIGIINYQLQQNNIILQDLYEIKKDN